MTIKFAHDNNQVRVFDLDEENVNDKLRVGVYRVSFTPQTGFYLTKVSDKFNVPKKLYGSTNQRVSKIINTYDHREEQLGIMLTGIKGAGKTILTEALCNRVMEEKNIPVIMVNEPYTGSNFMQFLQSIGECVILFDEFGKTYTKTGDSSQEELLTLFDGAYSTRRMILLTENSMHNVNTFILDRPSRIHYHFQYNMLEQGVILEYCQHVGFCEQKTKEVIELSSCVIDFSFDMLETIVQESFLYPDVSILDLVKDLNVSVSAKASVVEVMVAKRASTGEDLKVIKDRCFIDSDGDYVLFYEEEDEDGEILVTHIYLNNRSLSKVKNGIQYHQKEDIVAAIKYESKIDDKTKLLF